MFSRRGATISSRAPFYLALAIALAASVLAIASLSAMGETDKNAPIQLSFSTASPISDSQCSFCHGVPGDFVSDRLTFKHAKHFAYRCSACHTEFPHSPDGLKKPTMDLCFSCHGLNHGVQGTFADGKCEKCHPPTAPKVPSNHTDSWKASDHKAASLDGLRTCGMCHDPKSCEDCHAANGVSVKRIQTSAAVPNWTSNFIFEPVTAFAAQEGVTISVGQVASMSQCAPCHPNIDGFRNPNLIFKHDVHLSRSISCDRCHTAFPHSGEVRDGKARTEKPPMELCYGCHGIVHSDLKVAADDCGVCHPQGMNLVPSSHTDDFKSRTHPDEAKKKLAICEMCHQPSFCANCHTAKQVIAKSHGMGKYENKEVRTKWRKIHGKEAMAKEDCWVCHSKQYCFDCHKTEIPHSVTWLGVHGKLAKGQERQCNKCHQDKTTCQECHHGNVKASKLTKQNCIRCHELYRYDFKTIYAMAQKQKAAQGGVLSPEDSRYYRGYSVHSAHFEMTNTPPFVCERCHGDTIKQGAQYYPFNTLCARCHGAYQNGKLIAKFDIPELCFRCHVEKRGLVPP